MTKKVEIRKYRSAAKTDRLNKEKIEEAAYDFEDGELMEDKLKRAAFKYGINWFKENLWHDINEKPEKDKLCLVKIDIVDGFKIDSDYTTSSFNDNGWTENYFPDGYNVNITHWLYIEDLMGEK